MSHNYPILNFCKRLRVMKHDLAHVDVVSGSSKLLFEINSSSEPPLPTPSTKWGISGLS